MFFGIKFELIYDNIIKIEENAIKVISIQVNNIFKFRNNAIILINFLLINKYKGATHNCFFFHLKILFLSLI